MNNKNIFDTYRLVMCNDENQLIILEAKTKEENKVSLSINSKISEDNLEFILTQFNKITDGALKDCKNK